MRVIRNHSDINNHVVPKVLISCNKGDSLFILKADAFGGAFVQTIEVLDSGNYRVSCIMRKYLHSHRQPSTIVGSTIEKQFEGDVFRCRTGGGDTIMGWNGGIIHTVG